MVTSKSFLPKSINIFLVIFSIFSSLNAASSAPDRLFPDDDDNGFRFYREIDRMGRFSTMSKSLQRINELKAIPKAIEDIDGKIRELNEQCGGKDESQIRQQIEAWEDAKRDLLNILNTESKIGKAYALGLAGANDAKMLQDMRINSLAEGVKIGASIRVARACSDALGKRIENSIDRVLGGAWDSFITAIIDGWTNIYQTFFHSGQDPFSAKQLKGWQSLVKTTFEDIDRLMKDGLKDSLRGHDMTLRHPDLIEEAEEEQEPVITAWQMLIAGYIRQFEYVVLQLEKHFVYYNNDETVGFYATELKERLKETNRLLIQASSLKELDDLLDSNKSLILGLKNNILNLFNRLLEIVEQPAAGAGSSSSSAARDTSRRDGMRSPMDDDSGPRSFRGGF